jgi:hypothetical protein
MELDRGANDNGGPNGLRQTAKSLSEPPNGISHSASPDEKPRIAAGFCGCDRQILSDRGYFARRSAVTFAPDACATITAIWFARSVASPTACCDRRRCASLLGMVGRAACHVETRLKQNCMLTRMR